MFERFTERARQVITLGQDEARQLKHAYIGTEHLLLGLLREEEGIACRVLDSLGVHIGPVRAEVVRIVGEGMEPQPTTQLPLTPRCRKVLDLSLREALSLGRNYIGTEHILLGLVRENEGVAARILSEAEADGEKIRNEVIRSLSGTRRHRRMWEREDVDLQQLWTKGDAIYRVVSIADDPTVTIEDIRTGERHSHVIRSPLFAEFDRLTRESTQETAA